MTAPVSTTEVRPVPQQQTISAQSNAATEDQQFTPRREDMGDIDASPSRADLAYREEFDKWTGLIEAAANDLGVPKDQRMANVAALRIRQIVAAKAVSKRVRDEEKSAARAARRARRILLGLPVPPL